MRVELNGDVVDLADGSSIREAVEQAGAGGESRGVAAALDGEVVPREAWDETKLREGQAVEVVRAVQGG